MPKKTKVIEVACPKERASVPFEENEPEGAQEVEEVEEAQEAAPEVEEIKTKPKRVLSEKQLEITDKIHKTNNLKIKNKIYFKSK